MSIPHSFFFDICEYLFDAMKIPSIYRKRVTLLLVSLVMIIGKVWRSSTHLVELCGDSHTQAPGPIGFNFEDDEKVI